MMMRIITPLIILWMIIMLTITVIDSTRINTSSKRMDILENRIYIMEKANDR